MVTTSRIKITGAKELDRALRDLPGAMGQNVLRGALRQGANVIKAEAQNNLSSPRALVVKNRRGKKGLAKVVVTLRPEKWYLRFFEFGAAPHTIYAEDIKSTILADGDGAVFGKVIHHPGMAARPFLRPAADTKAGEAIKRVGDELWVRIAKAAQKITSGQVNARTGRKVR